MENNIFEIISAVIFSVGSAGGIILALSSWLGKVWANRLMEEDRNKYKKELTELKTQLEKEAEHNNHLLKQKIALYQEVANPVTEIVTTALLNNGISDVELQKFETKRLQLTALLGMFAPLVVFERYNEMVDYLYDCVEHKQVWSFDTFRLKAFAFLSEARRDIGLYADDLVYTGSR